MATFPPFVVTVQLLTGLNSTNAVPTELEDWLTAAIQADGKEALTETALDGAAAQERRQGPNVMPGNAGEGASPIRAEAGGG